ncbi:MAG: non-canonical purine NTP pyrophosphatase [Cyclobacteriaceae bacterium]
MNDITFLTTNHIKLFHARYLSRDWDINIIQHKLLHYGIGYEEPRLFDREKLLEGSVKDAISRWKKNISDSESRFYFLKDTSVVIHSISKKGKEVPGVDIKYWMQENTFSQIDNILKLKGNNRRVSVNSHVVLVLTKDLKEKYGEDYIIFKSNSKGYLVEKKIIFETNILYSWLDNFTFNKWFVPEGEEVPISLLPIEKADKYDFRKNAFDKMFIFLRENKKIFKKKTKEIQSRFLLNPIFIISG